MRYDQGLRNASRAYGELQEWRARLVKQRASKADDAIDTKLALAESHAETSKRISAALRGNGDWKEISLDTTDVTAFCQSTKAWFAEIAPDDADADAGFEAAPTKPRKAPKKGGKKAPGKKAPRKTTLQGDLAREVEAARRPAGMFAALDSDDDSLDED